MGDVDFQKKCLGKMREVGQQGRTVLFVSHQLATIRTLCDRGIILRQGVVVADEPIDRAITAYLLEASGQHSFERAPQSNGKPTLVSGQVEVDQSRVRIAVNIVSHTNERVHVHTRLTDGVGNTAGFGSVGSSTPNIRLPFGQDPISLGTSCPWHNSPMEPTSSASKSGCPIPSSLIAWNIASR